MSVFLEVAGVSDLPEGTMKKFTAGDREILLAKTGGRVYAADALCPHLGADLSEGSLEGTILTCPFHNSRFDLRDGHVVRWTNLAGIVLSRESRMRPPRPLPVYPVHIEGEKILVRVPA